jgi:hypothetical protein
VINSKDMFRNYLGLDYFFMAFVSVMMTWLFASVALGLVVLLSWALMFFLFRKNRSVYKELLKREEVTLLSPINGQISGVRAGVNHPIFGDNLTEVQMRIPIGVESGLNLPFNCEVAEIIETKGKSFYRYNEFKAASEQLTKFKGILVKLTGRNGNLVGLQMVKCHMGGSPRLWVSSGDRGKMGANFGQFPLGGTLLMYLMPEYDVIIESGSSVDNSQTFLAGLKTRAGIEV